MSAENEIVVFQIETGAFVVVERSCGDTVMGAWGSTGPVLAEKSSYEAAFVLACRMSDEDDPAYVYTEYGFHEQPEDTRNALLPRYLGSRLAVTFRGERVRRVMDTDASEASWALVERSAFSGRMRVLGGGMTLAEAVVAGRLYQARQPFPCRFCPPHGAPDYAQEVYEACDDWYYGEDSSRWDDEVVIQYGPIPDVVTACLFGIG